MLLGKHPFFFLLLGLIITPFIISKIVWFTTTEKTMGRVAGIGHESGMSLGISSYSLVEFSMGNKIFSFHGGEENLKEGDMVAIRYPRTNPEDAKLDTWLTTLESLAFIIFKKGFLPTIILALRGKRSGIIYSTPHKINSTYIKARLSNVVSHVSSFASSGLVFG